MKPTLDEMIPPPELDFVGGHDFKIIGQAILSALINNPNCGLRPDESVLDIGCGIGRVAIPMTQYLSERGLYEGFDVNEMGVTYCKQHISPHYPNFNFTHVDLHNTYYNPTGAVKATEFRFPFEDETFSFAFATSVMTHLLPETVDNYLRETARVLKPGGRFLCTWFLLNQESEQAILEGRSQLSFAYERGEHCRISVPDNAEAIVAYKEDFVKQLYIRSGFKIMEPIGYGVWCGRDAVGGFQDGITSIKPRNNS